MSDTSDAPFARFDAGEKLYVIVDEEGRHLSHHDTYEGAEAVREGYGRNAKVIEDTLYRD
jgi:hypothetical protein